MMSVSRNEQERALETIRVAGAAVCALFVERLLLPGTGKHWGASVIKPYTHGTYILVREGGK